jgi:L-ribulose-5-phosphate 4-epimerase
MSKDILEIRTQFMRGAAELMRQQGVLHDSHGNLSVRVGDLVGIKPSGMSFDEIHGYDVCIVKVDGTVEQGHLKPSVDLENHLQIYRSRSDVKAIVHTHSPYATAWSAIGALPCYFTEQCDYFEWRVPCVQSICKLSFDWGKSVVAETWKNENAFLISNHGTVTVGTNPIEAIRRAAALESICMKTMLATSSGEPLMEIPYEVAKAWNERYRTAYGQK